MDKMERDRKREARKAHKISEFAQKSFGLRAKLFNQKRFKEKAAMRKTLALHKEGSNKHANDDKVTDGKFTREEVNQHLSPRSLILVLVVLFQVLFLRTCWTERTLPALRFCPTL